jgi:signal peptidase I
LRVIISPEVFELKLDEWNMDKKKIIKFLFPGFSRIYFIRVGVTALLAFIFFAFICVPVFLKGKSMEPTYHDGSFNFCWRLNYLFSSPQKGDVVVIRFAGNSVMLLKRVVAFEGDTVEFRKGRLFVNGAPQSEPYVKNRCDWELEPRKVDKGNIYVIGDNRSMPIVTHEFGQTSLKRVMGAPLW